MPTGSFQQYVIGATLFVVAIFTGIIMSWIGGQLIDGFYANELNGQALVPDSLIDYVSGTPFYTATSNLGEAVYFVNLFYLLCYACPILGLFLLWQSLVKYQSAEYYGSMFYGDDGSQSGGKRRRRRRR